MFGGLGADVRIAVRALRRSPGFTFAVTLTLALGIGANTALFSAVRAVLLRPLPYPDADRIQILWGENPSRGWLEFGASGQDFEDWQSEATRFESMAAYNIGEANLAVGDGATRVGFGMVSPELFRVLGVQPALGRHLRNSENRPGHDDVAVVSHGFWERILGGQPDAIGQIVRLNGRPLTVVGVMPPDFGFPDATTELWKPFGMTMDAFGSRGARWLGVVGRLESAASVETAQAELDAIMARLASQYPESNRDWVVRLESFQEGLVGDSRPALLAMWAAVGVLMLLICANVANLLLGRSIARRRELAIRKALGAGSRRLIGGALAESLVLSLGGALLGIGIAWAGVSLLSDSVGPLLPRGETIALDLPVLLFGLGLALATGMAFALFPGIAAARTEASDPLRAARGSSESSRIGRLRRGLVVAQVATAFVVLAGAGLSLRSAWMLREVDPGFEAGERVSFQIAPDWERYAERREAVDFYEQLRDRLASIPGVESVAGINVPPLVGGEWWNAGFSIEGESLGMEDRPNARVRIVTPAWFETMGIPIVRGRAFAASDRATGEPVVVISQQTAKTYWPDDDPLARRVTFDDPANPDAPWYTVVGIAGDLSDATLDQAPSPMAYMSLAQAGFGHFGDWRMTVTMQVTPGTVATALAGHARQTVAELDPSLPVYSIQAVSDYVSADLAERSVSVWLLSVFAIIATVLAAIGVYGVLAYAVARRTREIGTRMALGATPSNILADVTRRGGILAVIGVALGLLVTVAGSRLVVGLLYGISANDPATLAAISAMLLGVTVVASLIPARRAATLQPMEALRSE